MTMKRFINSICLVLLSIALLLCSMSCKKADNKTSSEIVIEGETIITTESGKTVILSGKNDKKESSDNKSDKTDSKDKVVSANKDSANTTETSDSTGSSNKEDTEEEDIYSTFHKYEKWVSASDTHHTSKCADCGKTEKIVHIWNDGSVTTNPTGSASGVLTYTCQLCGKTKTENITYAGLHGDEYSTGRKTAETYQAASTREFKLYGAAYSDDKFAALYGDCPVGVTVLAQSEDGCYAVDSSNGTFALRIKSESDDTEFLFSLWHNGNCISAPFTKSVKIYTSKYDNDNDGWKPMLGYDNQGFFEKILDCHTRKRQMTSQEMNACTNKFAERVIQCKQNNREIICVLAPSALTVYPENVPEKYKQANKTSYYDQVATSLKKAGVTVLDLREAFNKHRYDKLPLYNKYDTHWTDYGAYIAYVEMYKLISQKYPAATPRKFNEFKWVEGYYAGSDIPSYFGVDEKPGKYVLEYTVRRDMTSSAPQVIKNINRFKLANSVAYDSYSEDVMKKRTYNTGNPELPNISLIKNSYGIQIQDIIAERSNMSILNEIWAYKFNNEQYRNNNINYVVYVLSEWEFDRITNN